MKVYLLWTNEYVTVRRDDKDEEFEESVLVDIYDSREKAEAQLAPGQWIEQMEVR